MSAERNARSLPGLRLVRIAASYFDRVTAETTLMPIVADLQHELCDRPRGTIARWFLLVRGYWNFWTVIGLLRLTDRKAHMRAASLSSANALGRPGTQSLCVGIASILLLMLAWAALDDITTDTATAFVPEYSILVVCGIWFTAVAVWLLVRRRALTGIISLFAVALAVIAFWSLPHHYGQGSPINYLGLLSLAWFLALAVWMAARRGGAVKHPTRS
jgi:hypothetical protein